MNDERETGEDKKLLTTTDNVRREEYKENWKDLVEGQLESTVVYRGRTIHDDEWMNDTCVW